MSQDNYQKALDFIYNRQHFGIKLGLHNITRLSEWLDNPQDKYNIVHVAGTNGKGSTSSFIASILQEAGYKVGLLTSPHLVDYRERIRLDGRKIEKTAIAEFIEKYKKLIVKSDVTFFEVTTALAFWYFYKKKADWVVLETGLGGRLDATNIVMPRVSVITNISLEHTNLLGKSIYKIAGEKGGIIKSHIPLVAGISDNGNEASQRFKEICAEKNSPVYFHDDKQYRYAFENGYDILNIFSGEYRGLKARVSLWGKHQVQNSYLAVRTIDVLNKQGFDISKKAVKNGLAKNYWPGRCMTVRKRPRVIIDAAHNQEGFAALSDTLRMHFPGQKFHFLIGMVEKKHGDACLRMIEPLAKSISTARIKNPRRDDPYFLTSRLNYQKSHVRIYPDIPYAFQDLYKNCSQTDILIIAGSHFIMGELALFIKRDGF
ncbi:MAG: folylpolyglutamate synthase/dihydrofolate synthase family protein [candidate division Zixibacteria bacterium]